MFLDATDHVASKFKLTEINNSPYPHLQIDNIFPEQMYQQMLTNEIPDEFLKPLYSLNRTLMFDKVTGKRVSDDEMSKQDEAHRTLIRLSSDMPELPDPQRLFWEQAATWLLGPVNQIIIEKIKPYLIGRFMGVIPRLESEVLYTRDTASYALGPHTDTVNKVATLLFYMPADDSLSHLGTSMYIPTANPAFTCDGGPHYPFKGFKLVNTAPFKPNTMFGFVKTKNSFHGVENIKENIRRHLLIFDIRAPKP